MATQATAFEGNTDPTPVACTLTSADLATQSDRWKQLAARAMIERVETDHGLRISFRPESGVDEELHKLVAVENECCSWADWTVEMNADRIVLDVRSSREGIATLQGMFTSLQPARRGERNKPRFAGLVMELAGLEPATSWVRSRRRWGLRGNGGDS